MKLDDQNLFTKEHYLKVCQKFENKVVNYNIS